MTDITPARANIQTEETDFNSALSEALFQKVGALGNFINYYQFDTKMFFLNGPYAGAAGTTGLDGLIVFPFDVEIVGMYAFNLVAGSSGTTTFDVHWFNGTGSDQGTIFSTRPSITSAAGNNAYMSKVVASESATSEGGTGLTLPVFSKTEFDQFDAIRIDLDAAQTGAENCGIGIWIRPR